MTGFALKVIALASMITDHIGAVLIPQGILRYIGRIAFPVYAFLIAEGCRTTRSMPKYIGRLAVFAVISEPVYRMAMNRQGMGLRNIFPTLALGAAAIYLYQLLKPKGFGWLSVPFLIVCMAAAWYLGSDYGGFGVILIFLLYVMPARKAQTAVLIVWSAAMYLGWTAWNGSTLVWLQNPSRAFDYYIPMFVFACISAVLVYLYNGERGRKTKWAFYIAYPLHLLILAGVRELFFMI